MKSLKLLFICFILTISCNKNKKIKISTNGVPIPEKIENIISTAPSNTDIILGLNLFDKLKVVSNYDKDTILKDKIKVNFDNINIEFFIQQKPDIIITSEHNISNGINIFKSLEKFNIPVIYIPTANKIEDIYQSISFLSKIFKQDSLGQQIINNMKDNIKNIKKLSKQYKRKTVYFEIDEYNGVMYSFGKNTFLNSILENLNLENIFNNSEYWIRPSSETIILKNPDIIISTSMKENINVDKIYKRKGWENISAIKNKQVFWIDADMVSRCSQKTIECHYSIIECLKL